MKKGRPKGTTGKARVLSKNEIEAAITFVQKEKIGGKHTLRNTAILATSYYLGLRAKEIAGLRTSDVVGLNGEISIEVQLIVTKGNKSRTVYIPEVLREILKTYINTRNESYNMPLLKSPLFRSQKGSYFTPNTMQYLLKQIYLKCAFNGCSSHTGRRSFATQLIENGADIKAVSTLMGHSSINMTAKYVEDNPHRLQKMVNTLL